MLIILSLNAVNINVKGCFYQELEIKFHVRSENQGFRQILEKIKKGEKKGKEKNLISLGRKEKNPFL